MTSKSRRYILLAVLAFVILVGGGLSFYRGAHLVSLPSQSAWNADLASSTNQTLFGAVVSVKSSSIVVFVQQPNLGTTTVTIASSTSVVKNTPLSSAEMAAAFKEFQKEQTASDGKPFTPPSSSKTITLTLVDLKMDDTVLITLTPESTKNAFAAQKIEVLPTPAPQAVTNAAPIPVPAIIPPPPK